MIRKGSDLGHSSAAQSPRSASLSPYDITWFISRVTFLPSFRTWLRDRAHLCPIFAVGFAVHLRVSAGDSVGLLAVVEGGSGLPQTKGFLAVKERVTREVEPLCSVMDSGPDFCDVRGQARVHGNSSTVFLVSVREIEAGRSFRVRPYVRKGNPRAMSNVREWSVLQAAADAGDIPRCMSFHGVPTVLFSAGGFSGNYFHDYADLIVPLYLTARSFEGEVRFLVSDMKPWWIRKFSAVYRSLSNYDIIDLDKEQGTHCFTRVIIGLRFHKELVLDPSRPPHHSMQDFRAFLRDTYSLRRVYAIDLTGDNRGKRPRLLIVSRKRTRAFMNVASIARMADELRYEVIVAELDYNVLRSAEIVNSCDIMMGVHGAGLTNFLFLPDHAVFIQVIPIGGVEPHARVCFGDPARRMDMRYLEYRIAENESTLIRQFRLDDVVLKDPVSYHKHDWDKFKSIYLDQQNVELDVNRFRSTLVQAMNLLHV